LIIDTTIVRGEFKKKAIVWSNDVERRSVALYLMGNVRPYISFDPGGYLSLRGVKGQVPSEHLHIINNQENPMKITGIDNDLPEHIIWTIEEIKSGYIYRLDVEDISVQAGTYTGHLFVRTDNPKKPELVIIVNGEVKSVTF
jgi:hypothetical protein